MKKPSRFATMLSLALVCSVSVFIFSIARANSSSPSQLESAESRWEIIQAISVEADQPGILRRGQLATTPPPEAKQDPCMHCHVTGENKGLWTPLARWSLFTTLGLVFVFGVYTSASTWTSRLPWKP